MVAVRRLIGLVLLGLILVGGWTFAGNHGNTVSLNYWFGEIDGLPLWLVLLAAFLSGVLVSSLLLGFRMARSGLTARRYRSAISGLEEEVHQLRNLPLSADEAEGPEEPTVRLDTAGGAGGGG